MPDTLDLMIACNHPDNGNFQGFVERVDLHDQYDVLLRLAGSRLSCRFLSREASYKKRTLKIGHVTVNVVGHSSWVGNWCWDSVRVTPDDAARLVNYLHRHKWNAEIVEVRLGDKLDSGQKITGADIRRVS